MSRDKHKKRDRAYAFIRAIRARTVWGYGVNPYGFWGKGTALATVTGPLPPIVRYCVERGPGDVATNTPRNNQVRKIAPQPLGCRIVNTIQDISEDPIRLELQQYFRDRLHELVECTWKQKAASDSFSEIQFCESAASVLVMYAAWIVASKLGESEDRFTDICRQLYRRFVEFKRNPQSEN